MSGEIRLRMQRGLNSNLDFSLVRPQEAQIISCYSFFYFGESEIEKSSLGASPTEASDGL